MKTRIRFTKTGSMKFIGHLDCMRFFQKAFRRAGLDVAYSQGYSPHQLMSFASPLGVGVTSDGEYLDVEFYSLPDMPLPDLIAHMNRFMTEEIFVTGFEIMPDGFKNSMSLLRAADYVIVEKRPGAFPENWRESWEQFAAQPSIRVVKKSKKTETELDIKPHILAQAFTVEAFSQTTGQDYGVIHCEYMEADKEAGTLYLQLTSGSSVNIKPELVMEAFFAFCGWECPPFSCQVHRLQMYFAAPDKKEEAHG